MAGKSAQNCPREISKIKSHCYKITKTLPQSPAIIKNNPNSWITCNKWTLLQLWTIDRGYIKRIIDEDTNPILSLFFDPRNMGS